MRLIVAAPVCGLVVCSAFGQAQLEISPGAQIRLNSSAPYVLSQIDCAAQGASELFVEGPVELRHPDGPDRVAQGRGPIIFVRCAHVVFAAGSMIRAPASLQFTAERVTGPVTIHSSRGISGAPGSAGANGGDGANAGDVTLLTGTFASGASVKIYARGGRGGAAGVVQLGGAAANGGRGGDGGDVAIVVRTGGNAPAEVQTENQGGAGGEGARLGFDGNLGRIKNELP